MDNSSSSFSVNVEKPSIDINRNESGVPGAWQCDKDCTVNRATFEKKSIDWNITLLSNLAYFMVV